eukprot:CAMPEP_0116030000 /NCGR_PEP_ID=MMETSP0321-20121206/16555_1 /TAXON_ID=163516 /ORGANISM="Leptocylindrus danicus var. danicus, Strain B650" /LENGTH=176 /DNA_ID=CAMNT_0003504645 /DNA_START=180 /DNA_END=708 /DNA_ORIENTATION=+
MDVEQLSALVIAERNLTRAIEAARPYIKNNSNNYTNKNRIYPIPKTMTEVSEILALSHTLSSRTSAPNGWDPATMAITANFATPAPLPHQLALEMWAVCCGLQLKLVMASNSKAKKKGEDESSSQADEDVDMEDVAQQKDDATAQSQQNKRQRSAVAVRREDAGARARRKKMASMK